MQVHIVNINSRTSYFQNSLFSEKNPIIRIFCFSGWLAIPINPDKCGYTPYQLLIELMTMCKSHITPRYFVRILTVRNRIGWNFKFAYFTAANSITPPDDIRILT